MGSSLHFPGEGSEMYKIQLVMNSKEAYVLDLTNLSLSILTKVQHQQSRGLPIYL